MFGFILFHISYLSSYKRCANPSLNRWDHMWVSTYLMVDLQKKYAINGQENNTKHIPKSK